ncbi:MAG: hypothetical protein K9N49_00810 [Candidatus Marinimicrobia bacterium]|nr:hypothetical protein [Candidatus Neomarinimicrobiota bacterium]
MQRVVVAGFLGAGKTTLLLELAKRYTEAGFKIAIIENEAGQQGIDGAILSSAGYQVREIYAGCICCTLQGHLTTALDDIYDNYHPDILLVEPSGIASPGMIKDALWNHKKGEQGTLSLLMLLDLARLAAIQEKASFFIERSLQDADIVVLTKTDLVAGPVFGEAEAFIRLNNPQAPIVRLDYRDAGTLSALINHISHFHARQMNTGNQVFDSFRYFTAVSREQTGSVARRLGSEELRKYLAEILQGIAAGLRDAGKPLIGHIKCLLKPVGAGYLTASLLDYDNTIYHGGELGALEGDYAFRINAVLVDFEKEKLERILTQGLETFPRGPSGFPGGFFTAHSAE